MDNQVINLLSSENRLYFSDETEQGGRKSTKVDLAIKKTFIEVEDPKMNSTDDQVGYQAIFKNTSLGN